MSSNLMAGSEGMPGGDDDPEPNCPDCGGEGTVKIAAHEGDKMYEPCERCDGTGFIELDYDDTDDWRWDEPHGGES